MTTTFGRSAVAAESGRKFDIANTTPSAIDPGKSGVFMQPEVNARILPDKRKGRRLPRTGAYVNMSIMWTCG